MADRCGGRIDSIEVAVWTVPVTPVAERTDVPDRTLLRRADNSPGILALPPPAAPDLRYDNKPQHSESTELLGTPRVQHKPIRGAPRKRSCGRAKHPRPQSCDSQSLSSAASSASATA